MAVINLIGDGGEQVQCRVISRDVVVETEPDVEGAGFVFEPSVVQRVEYDHRGQTSSITSVCGETENRRESDEKPSMTIEGIMVEDELGTAKSLKEGDEVRVVSDVHSGRVFVRRLSIEQNQDVTSINVNEDGCGFELAFPFQLQLKQPE